jgi:hypothetical protein
MNKIKGLLVNIGEKPVAVEFENTYKNLCRFVEGRLEAVYLDRNICLFCNEEGKLLGLDGNRNLSNGDVIAGNFIIVGDNGEGENISLTDNQIEKYSERFEHIERYICVNNMNLDDDIDYEI